MKTAIQAYAGFQAEILVYAIGLDIEEKARSVELQLRKELTVSPAGKKGIHKLEVQLLGSCAPNPKSTNAATAIVRVFAQATDEESLSTPNFQYKVIQNLGQSFPGFTPNLEYLRTSQPRPYLAYFPALIDRSRVQMTVHWLDSQSTITVPHMSRTISDPADVKQENYEPTGSVDLSTFGSTIKVPLGHQVFARSGDKGANVNIGFFPQGDSQEEWDWLRTYMSTKNFLELLAEDAKDVARLERVEFPQLKSVHFVLFGLLGGGVTDTSRPDALGKVSVTSYNIASSLTSPCSHTNPSCVSGTCRVRESENC